MKRTATLRAWLVFLGALVAVAAFAWTSSPRRSTTALAPTSDRVEAATVVAPAPVAVNVLAPKAEPRASSTHRAPKPARSEAQAAQPAQAGMRVYLNPETGTYGAPAQPLDVIEPLSRAPVEALEVERLPDGSIMVDLKGTMEEYAIMRIGPNGERIMDCVSDPNAALKGGVIPASKPVEE